MSERPSYVCRECETPVTSGAYRATCPECGGSLRPRAYNGRTDASVRTQRP